MTTTEEDEAVGARIRRFRDELGMSLGDLAERADVSKGYLSVLENEPPDGTRRPSGKTLHRIAQALGVTIGDLLGEPLNATAALELPPGLQQFAEDHGLPESDVQMLAWIEFRGRQPRTAEAWQFIYQAIRMSS
jgi:transcriptional regulator with XRE-family HTH domain